jgi:predicted permease
MLHTTEDSKIKILLNFTFMLPCIVIDFFLNNQPDALIMPNLFYHKILHVSGIFSAIIRSFLLYFRHWQVSCRFLMTASKQSQDGNASSVTATASSILTLLGSGNQTYMKLTSAECTVGNS